MRSRQADREKGQGVSKADWVYWGASGILQPLSDEFLYRSPTDALRASGNCRVHGRGEVRRAVR